MARPSTSAVLVAAGQGLRAGGEIPKQYREIGGKTVLAHAVDALVSHMEIASIQLVIGADHGALCAAALAGRDLPPPVIGGATRRESVRAGLTAVDGERVLIHDAARPFTPPAVIDRLLTALDDAPGAVPVLPVDDTLARGEVTLGNTVARDGLWRVQTPQAFHLAAIRAAHAGWTGGEATDDAQVARAAGLRVAMVAGDRRLDKLTGPEDLALAARSFGPDIRTGSGFDVHAFAPGDSVWLCGVQVPHDRALAGHSDADVGLHALTDALLGAIADGDIGDHFPPSDPRWRGAPSHLFVSHARERISTRNARITNVDVTLICEQPRVGPHRAAMRARIAALLGLAEDRIGVKATTTESLGFTGRREGIAAQATATVVFGE